MKSVYKYPFHSLHGYITLYVPFNAKLLCVNGQKDRLAAWFEVDTGTTEGQYHVFYIALTGESIQDEMEYINTIFFDDDYIVHVYKEVQ
jgi:hypothetical protein